MTKTFFADAKIKRRRSTALPGRLISALSFFFVLFFALSKDSIICLFSKSKILGIYLVSEALPAGLCMTRRHVFFRQGSYIMV